MVANDFAHDNLTTECTVTKNTIGQHKSNEYNYLYSSIYDYHKQGVNCLLSKDHVTSDNN